ncbi:MAG: urease accessory protein [Lewinellaceae bacterium]|nr:urease accessory protein [Saprospiraceae bacterium]MCB9334000.1 urease accessory protein [Lewinellaceae bacterium]
MEVAFPVVFAAMLGFSHAFEADHLLAVSSIVTRRNSVWLAIKDGIAWGLGHTSTIFLIGLMIILGKVAITEKTFHYFEAAVGAMLVGLGLLRLRFLWKNGGATPPHMHLETFFFSKKQRRQNAIQVPFRPANFNKETSADMLRFAPGQESHRLAYFVGLVHGLAGSGALVLLVMSQIPGPAAAMGYLLVFGLGSIGGMLLASGVFSLPFSKKITTNATLQIGLTLLSSLLCVGYGMQVIVENLTS